MSSERPASPLSAGWWILSGELFEILTAAVAALWLVVFRASWRVAVPAATVFYLLALLAKVRGESLEAEARRLARLDPGPPGKD